MAGGRADADVLDRPAELHRRARGSGGKGGCRNRHRIRGGGRRAGRHTGSRQRAPPQGGPCHRRRRGGLSRPRLAGPHAVVPAAARRGDPAARSAHRRGTGRRGDPKLHRVLVRPAPPPLHPGFRRGGLSRPAMPRHGYGRAAGSDRRRPLDPDLPSSRTSVPEDRRPGTVGPVRRHPPEALVERTGRHDRRRGARDGPESRPGRRLRDDERARARGLSGPV